jgi:cytochrome c
MKRIAIMSMALVVATCGEAASPVATPDPVNGKLLLRQFGCGQCHRIPGVAAADGNVGPPLDAIARRAYLAGVLPNTPENMTRWIRAPRTIDPRTAMPDLGVTEAHARDMTAYLYTLR